MAGITGGRNRCTEEPRQIKFHKIIGKQSGGERQVSRNITRLRYVTASRSRAASISSHTR